MTAGDTSEDDEAISLAEAAERLDVHYMTAYRWVRTGLLDAFKSGGQWRVRVADLRVPERRPPGRRSADEDTPRGLESLVERLASRLLAGDEPGSWQLVQDAITSGITPTGLHVDLLAPALRLVGEWWDRGEVGIAEEHRATAVATRIIGRSGPLFRRRGSARATVLVGTVEGERHALPVSMVADILRDRGIAVIDVGADAPALSVVSMLPASPAAGDEVDAVLLCSTTRGNPAVAPMLATIRSARPGIPILLGGAAVPDAGAATSLGADAWSGLDAVAAADAVDAVLADRDARRSAAGLED